MNIAPFKAMFMVGLLLLIGGDGARGERGIAVTRSSATATPHFRDMDPVNS